MLLGSGPWLTAVQAKNSTDIQELENLVLAVVLLQAIGLFHQNLDERMQSNMMHIMLIMVRL
jgi:hypothetical protein